MSASVSNRLLERQALLRFLNWLTVDDESARVRNLSVDLRDEEFLRTLVAALSESHAVDTEMDVDLTQKVLTPRARRTESVFECLRHTAFSFSEAQEEALFDGDPDAPVQLAYALCERFASSELVRRVCAHATAAAAPGGAMRGSRVSRVNSKQRERESCLLYTSPSPRD